MKTKIQKELQAFKQDVKQGWLIPPLLVFFTILILLLFGTSELQASDDLQFGDVLLKELPSYTNSWQLVDMNRLAWAVRMQETQDFKKGCGKTHNNGYGIMTWVNGRRQPKYYASKEESTADFIRIWTEHYEGRIPTYKDAIKWSGEDRSTAWYYNVHWHYNYGVM